jgi:hypothetical protein
MQFRYLLGDRRGEIYFLLQKHLTFIIAVKHSHLFFLTKTNSIENNSLLLFYNCI